MGIVDSLEPREGVDPKRVSIARIWGLSHRLQGLRHPATGRTPHRPAFPLSLRPGKQTSWPARGGQDWIDDTSRSVLKWQRIWSYAKNWKSSPATPDSWL